MADYVSLYGVNTWSMSTYMGNTSLINNYVLPIIGDVKLDDITPRMMDRYYQDLTKVNAKERSSTNLVLNALRHRRSKKYISSCTTHLIRLLNGSLWVGIRH